MKTHPVPFLRLLASLALLAGSSAAAHAQTVISSLPYTITASGAYVLSGNLNSTQNGGAMITVNASNVSIDFQNYYISGQTSGNQPSYGIYATERANLVIRNGTISHCGYGIYLTSNGDNSTTNAVNARIDTMRIAHCTAEGIVLFHQPSARITNCQIAQIGLSNSTSYTAGIDVAGPEVLIQGNSISDITTGSGLSAYCIYADAGVFERQNQLSNGTDAVRLGVYQDNLSYNCTNLFTGGVDAGGNFNQPGQ